MLSRCVSAALVLFVAVGFALAGEYTGVITKASEKEIEVTVRKKGEKEGEKKTFKVGKDVKITRKTKDGEDKEMTVDNLTRAIEKAKDSGKGAKGVTAKITTEGEDDKETVTKIAIIGGKKK